MVALLNGKTQTLPKRNCIPAESEDESDDKVASTAGRTPPASPTHELNLVASYIDASEDEQRTLLNFLHSVGALSTFIPDEADSFYTPSSPLYDPCSPAPHFP